MEIIALVGAYRNHTRPHGEAVEVAGYVQVHVGYLVQVEVVGGGRRELPVFGGPDIARQTEVLRYLAVIFHLLAVEIAVTVVHRIVHRQAPRHLPCRISVGRQLQVVVIIAVPVVEAVRLSVAGVIPVVILWIVAEVAVVFGWIVLVFLPFEGVVVEGVGEGGSG